MAKIAPIHGNMSGSIAGNTYSHNKGGQYVRQKTVPVNPSSTRQGVVRAALTTAARAWSGLTNIQRAAWEGFAEANPVIDRLGQSIVLSGIAMHNRLNAKIREFGGTMITTPPVTAAPVAPATFSVSANTANSLTLAFTPTPVGASNRVEVWATPPALAGVNPNFNQARLIATSPANQATAYVISTPWNMSAGQYINLWLRIVDSSGRVGPGLRVRYLCT